MTKLNAKRRVACCVFATDGGGEIQEPQSAWAEHTGQRFTQYRGAGWLSAIDSADVESVGRRWAEIIAEQKPARMRVVLRNGSEGKFEKTVWLCTPLYDRIGSPRHWIITISRAAVETPQRRPAKVVPPANTMATTLGEVSAALETVCEKSASIVTEHVADLSPEMRDQIAVIARSTNELKEQFETLQQLAANQCWVGK